MSDRPEVLIFDFDGVIVESVGIKTDAFRELFSSYPVQVEAIIDFHLKNDGLSRYKKFDHIFANILKEPLDADRAARLGARFSELALEKIKKCPFVPGAVEFLEEYSAKAPIYIASGTPEAELRDIVKVRGLERYFAGVFGTPATKSEIIGRVLAQEGAAPEKCLFVGDTMTDYLEAVKAGVKFIGRWDGTLPPENPFSQLTPYVIKDIFDLKSVLGNQVESDSFRTGG